jgi:ATPase subunit of ABC transporter with duplicated ATPase domains
LVGPNGSGESTLFAFRLGDVSPDNGRIPIEKNATIGFLPQETALQVRETLSAFVVGNDEPVSIVAMHSNIAFDFVELKLDGVLHDG